MLLSTAEHGIRARDVLSWALAYYTGQLLQGLKRNRYATPGSLGDAVGMKLHAAPIQRPAKLAVLHTLWFPYSKTASCLAPTILP